MVSSRRVPVEHLQRLDLLDLHVHRRGPMYIDGLLIIMARDHVEVITDTAPVRIFLTTTASTFGRRRWFLCPSCARRCRILVRDPRTPTWGCYECRRVTFLSRLRGRQPGYRLLERHRRQLERAVASRLRRPRSPKAQARYLVAADRYRRAHHDYVRWLAEQANALAARLQGA